jgi:hypothetical protein
MAKKKSEAADGGATKKQATGTKKAAAPKERAAPALKATTRAAATTTRSAASGEKSSAAGSAATKKRAPAKPAASPAGGSVPLIDTSLAAESAAKFVVNRALLGNAPPAAAPEPAEEEAQGGEKRETSTFKQLKAGLNKPASQGLGGILGAPTAGRKGNFGPGGGNQQVGRNQTFGADVNRSGVPRRTGG